MKIFIFFKNTKIGAKRHYYVLKYKMVDSFALGI